MTLDWAILEKPPVWRASPKEGAIVWALKHEEEFGTGEFFQEDLQGGQRKSTEHSLVGKDEARAVSGSRSGWRPFKEGLGDRRRGPMWGR